MQLACNAYTAVLLFPNPLNCNNLKRMQCQRTSQIGIDKKTDKG